MSEEHRPASESLEPGEPAATVARDAELAAVEPGTEPFAATPPDAAPAAAAAKPRRRVPLLAGAAAALLVAAIGAAALFWSQARETERAASRAQAEVAAALDALRADLGRVEQRAGALAAEVERALDAERRAREALAARVDSLPGRLADLDRRLAAVQGAPFEARTDWLRAEAEYYLAVASTELALGGRWENAGRALELADSLLAELGDPTLSPVREALAAERLALESVRLPDIERLAFDLGELAARAADLPLRRELPASYTPPPSAAGDEPAGLARLTGTIKSALSGLVRVERRDAPIAPELTAAERLLARRQLELELTLARVAAVDRQEALLDGALDRALELLRRDFDTEAAEVERAIALVGELAAIDVDPPRPTLGRALNQLRGIAGER